MVEDEVDTETFSPMNESNRIVVCSPDYLSILRILEYECIDFEHMLDMIIIQKWLILLKQIIQTSGISLSQKIYQPIFIMFEPGNSSPQMIYFKCSSSNL